MQITNVASEVTIYLYRSCTLFINTTVYIIEV